MLETFIDALTRHARERPNAVALSDDRVKLTWTEVAAWVEAASGWLVARGLPRQAPVLGWLPNTVEWYLLRLACERAGLLWVPVSSAQGVREVTTIAERVRPLMIVSPALFRGRDYAEEVCRICGEAKLETLQVKLPDDAPLRLDSPHADPARATRLDEGAHILTTTGSEGIPKLALYTLAAAAERARAQAVLLGITPDDVVVALSTGTGPGKTSWLAAPMAGAAVFTLSVFRAEQALEMIERERATIVSGTPAQISKLLSDMLRFDVSSVRLWYMSGSVLPPALAEALEARTEGVAISVYGATDFGGWAAPDLGDAQAVRHRTVGRPRGGTEFRVVDMEGHNVPKGEVGEILGRGPCCVSGYYGDPELTRKRWRGGWFQTGDLGRFDEQGNLVILGRARDLIIRGGDNIAPDEIEKLLRTHPSVSQVAVVGIPDPVLGERVCACVVPLPGSPPTLETLREHLRREGIAHYKLPERLVVLSALPTVGDKVDRLGLAARATAEASSD